MRRSKPPRGRRIGQAAKHHAPELSLGEHARLAQDGDFEPGVVPLLCGLEKLAKLAVVWERQTEPEALRLQNLFEQVRKDEARARRARGQADNQLLGLVAWLNLLAPTTLRDALRLLLPAAARRDRRFFADVARRIGSRSKLGCHAEAIFSRLVMMMLTKEPVPSVEDLSQSITTATGEDYSERAVRRAMQAMAISRRKRGRPKTGT